MTTCAAPLSVGDHVEVTYRTCGGPATWAGIVTDVDGRLRLATITGVRRHARVPLRGALYVRVRTSEELWDEFTDTHAWPVPAPAPA